MHPIAVIINYCTNDYRFLRFCVDHVSPFAKQIIVPVCDHFFDGTKENRFLLDCSYAENLCSFVEYPYDSQDAYGVYRSIKRSSPHWVYFWHSTSRYIGSLFLRDDIEYVLFLDVDEICDTKRFLQWLDTQLYRQFEAIKFDGYFYFREPCFAATSYQGSMAMFSKAAILGERLLVKEERLGVFLECSGNKIAHVRGEDDLPLFHHYSWVRPFDELLNKVKRWGHHLDKNWHALLHKEFAAPFRGFDLLYGLDYTTVPSFCNPLSVCFPEHVDKKDAHVTYVDRSFIKQRALQRELFLS